MDCSSEDADQLLVRRNRIYEAGRLQGLFYTTLSLSFGARALLVAVSLPAWVPDSAIITVHTVRLISVRLDNVCDYFLRARGHRFRS